jgi:hypothetical protein
MKNNIQKINNLKNLRVLQSAPFAVFAGKKCPGTPDLGGKYFDSNQ